MAGIDGSKVLMSMMMIFDLTHTELSTILTT
jgi:hypothetical protein